MTARHPRPLPPPLRGAEPGSFAEQTLCARLPGIARRVLAENSLDPPAAARVAALADDLPAGPIRPLDDPRAPDAAEWAGYAAPYLGQSWLTPPWFFAETLFFRRLLEATGYYQPGPGAGRDPYATQKQRGLAAAHAPARALAAWLDTHSLLRTGSRADPALVAELLRAALWGNQADLSLWPIDAATAAGPAAVGGADDRLVVDDSAVAAQLLAGLTAGRVALVADNAGLEVVGDLCLAAALLAGGAAELVLHVKPHPTYVSDVTAADVETTIGWLARDEHPPTQALGLLLRTALAEGRLQLATHFFWTSPLAGWELPDDLRAQLGQADLIISKGDANYRRWLGDRRWPHETPFAAALGDVPAPLLALRTLKSELAVGLAPGQADDLARRDPDWLTSGAWGVIQLAPAPDSVRRST